MIDGHILLIILALRKYWPFFPVFPWRIFGLSTNIHQLSAYILPVPQSGMAMIKIGFSAGRIILAVHFLNYGNEKPVLVPRWTAAALQRIAHHAGLASLHRDLALVCDGTSIPSDAASALPDCDAARVDKEGAIHPLRRNGLIAAQMLPADRMLLLTRNLSLLLRDTSGSESLIASSAANPRVSEDGTQVVFTQFSTGTVFLRPGEVGRIVSQKISDGKWRTVTEDPSASSPFPVPVPGSGSGSGSDDVLFLSARTGLASIWIASPGKPDRQITNVGKTKMDASFVPVFGQELV